MKWLALALLLSSCGMAQRCHDTYVRDMHPTSPFVLVRKCLICRDSSRLPTATCYAGLALPIGATLEAP